MDIVIGGISLNELFTTENISIRSQNICESNGLTNIDSILKFYSENHTFKKLRNCGNNSNEELISFCEKHKGLHIEPTILSTDILSITVEQLFLGKELNMRSKNSCGRANLDTLEDIVNYYKFNKTFKKIRNCGDGSNEELIGLCHKYMNSSKIEFQLNNNLIEEQIDKLSARQRKILNNLIESQASSLSVRSLNAINNFSGSNLSIRGLKEILIEPNYDLGKIKNIGRKSIEELTLFFCEINEQIETVQLFENDDELTIELFNTYLRRKFCLKQEDIVKIWNNYDSENGLPVFKTIDTLISNSYIFNDNEQEIFNRGFNFWTDSLPEKLEDIASDISLTRERTRQIRKKLLDEIDLRFTFLYGLEFDALNLYGLNADSDIVIVDETLIEEIQQKESVRYNDVFATKILAIIFNKTHEVVGNIESLAFNIVKYKGVDSKWNSIYLIKKEIKESYDFDSLMIDVKRRLSERIEEDYSFHFETYLTTFQCDGVETDYFVITQIAEHIIFNEFTITIDLDDNIKFKRNTIKQVFEYSYEALEALGEPSKVDVIYQKVKKLYPDYNTDENSIRASMKRINGFVPFGRTSIYGLKEWEEERNIRGGTIRDITEEFLLTQLVPKHIDEITQYVNKYRSTTAKNIYSNLQMEVNSRFKFYCGLFIGLKSKQYHNLKYTEVKERKLTVRSWEESFELLSAFVSENSRLPNSSGSEEEQKRYRFMNVQLNKISKDKLARSKAEKISELVLKYPVLRKKPEQRINNTKNKVVKPVSERVHTVTNRWWNSYNKLLAYLEHYNSYPIASVERALYTFCYNCKRGLESGKLHTTQIEALEKINFAFDTASINSWDDNYEELELFKTKNNGWPKCIDSDKKQIRLYRYCMSLFKAYKNKTLSDEQLEKLDKLEFPYQLGVFSNKWLDNFEKLKRFRATNPSIWPRAKGSELEKPLYQFCYRNRNKFINGTLEDYKIQLLNEIKFDFYG
ncbi:hypothetical protein QUH73_02085 [Labilibaculum sp. K2S]|uniref:hypothetical protein n=1 Tax=Labilibaculum sp. K2S TaxID=3056386 RepID=UPI0025A49DBB|nr:hypothetical protein [Labilibaculum sp. K2S]MDM8158597.1 hypothetical protein [Labilibaculum sp. K2S]